MYHQIQKYSGIPSNLGIIAIETRDEVASYYKMNENNEYVEISAEEFYNTKLSYTETKEYLEWKPLKGFWKPFGIEDYPHFWKSPPKDI